MAVEHNASSTNVTPERDTDRKRTRGDMTSGSALSGREPCTGANQRSQFRLVVWGFLEVRREALLHPYRFVGECRWQFSSRCLILEPGQTLQWAGVELRDSVPQFMFIAVLAVVRENPKSPSFERRIAHSSSHEPTAFGGPAGIEIPPLNS